MKTKKELTKKSATKKFLPMMGILGLSFGLNSGDGGSRFSFSFNNGGGSGTGWNSADLSMFGLPYASIYDIIVNILYWLLTVVGILGVIGFLVAGIMYLTAAGNDDSAKSAKKAMTNSAYGVIVALSGVVVIMAVDALLNAQTF